MIAQPHLLSPASLRVSGQLDQRIHLALRHLLAERSRILGGEGFGQAWGADQQGRWIGALAMTQAYLGEPIPALAEVVQRFVRTQAPNGFFGGTCNSLTWWGAGRALIGLVEYWNVTRDEEALQAALRLGNFYLTDFPLQAPGLQIHHGGHEEGLVALWRATGNEAYLALARQIPATVETDFGKPGVPSPNQHTHSYLSTLRGCVDLYLATRENEFLARAQAAWEHVLRHQMWSTGGISEGSNYPFETRDETCSVADWLRLSLHLWEATGEARYMAVTEHVLFNHLSFDQDHTGGFCAFRSVEPPGIPHVRDVVAWFCCSMHGQRALLDAARFIFTQTADALSVNLFITAEARFQHGPGQVELRQTADCVGGRVRLEVELDAPLAFTLRFRLPAWSPAYALTLNGETAHAALREGYIEISRTWQPGDRLEIRLELRWQVVPRGQNSFSALAQPPADAAEPSALMAGPYVLMVDPTLNIQALFEWEDLELLLPETAAGEVYLPKVEARVLGRGSLAVEGACFMTLARRRGGAVAAFDDSDTWKLVFLVPVAEVTDRWTYTLSRVSPYEIRNALRPVVPADTSEFLAVLRARFDQFSQQRQADTAAETAG